MKANTFLKYRNMWMGFAMIWIVWHHSKLLLPIGALNWIKDIGYGGVDICLFASGIGCYYSLSKDPDPYRFIKRRIIRLFPTYLCFIPFWIICKAVADSLPIQAMLGNVFAIQNFTALGNDFNWYVSAIFLFYFLAPFLRGLVNKIHSLPQQILIILLLVLLSIPFWNSNYFIITATRLPIFFIGMLFGKACYRNCTFSRWRICLLSASSVTGVVLLLLFYIKFPDQLWGYGLEWYPFILITPGLCILISFTMSFLDKFRWGRIISFPIGKIGEYSFEVYLIHIFITQIITHMIDVWGWLPNKAYVWLISFGCVFISCIILRFAARGLKKLLRLCFHPKKC